MAFTFDANNYLLVDIAAGGGSGSNAAAGPTGSAVPTSADYIGINVGGNLVGVSAANPLPITGSISATNPSVGTTGTTAPTSATEIGLISSGNLVGVSGTNPLPVTEASIIGVGSAIPSSVTVIGASEGGAAQPLLLDGSGNLKVTTVNSALSSTVGAAVPAVAVYIAGNQGGAVEPLLLDASGNLKVTTVNSALNSTIGASVPTSAVYVAANQGGALEPLNLDGSGYLEVDIKAGTVAISGTVTATVASTTVTNTVAENLTQVGGSAVSLGQALSAASIPVVLPAAQITTLTPPTTVTVTQATAANLNATVSGSVSVSNFPATQPVSGTVAVSGVTGVVEVSATTSANASGNPIFVEAVTGSTTAVTQATAANLNATVSIAAAQTLSTVTTVGAVTAITNALPAGTNTIGKVDILGNAGATLDSTIGAATAPTNALATSAVFNSTVPALTTGQAVAAQCDTTGSRYVNTEGRKQTYRVAAVAFAPLASSTNPSFSMTGSATKTIKIQKIRFSATAATGAAADIILRRYSALSGGTAASQSANIAKMDTNNAAATAVVNTWSVLATTATSAGIFNSERYEIVTAAVAVQPELIEWNFSQLPNAQALTLRGTSDFIGLCVSAIGTTPLSDIWIEWTEE